MKKRCKIVIKKLQIIVELNKSITASEIWKNLPIFLYLNEFRY